MDRDHYVPNKATSFLGPFSTSNICLHLIPYHWIWSRSIEIHGTWSIFIEIYWNPSKPVKVLWNPLQIYPFGSIEIHQTWSRSIEIHCNSLNLVEFYWNPLKIVVRGLGNERSRKHTGWIIVSHTVGAHLHNISE